MNCNKKYTVKERAMYSSEISQKKIKYCKLKITFINLQNIQSTRT